MGGQRQGGDLLGMLMGAQAEMVARQAQEQASICKVDKGPGDDAGLPAEPELARGSDEEKTCWNIHVEALEQADPCFANAMASWRSQLARMSTSCTAERQSQQAPKAKHAAPDAQACNSESNSCTKDDFLMACSHGTKREVQELLQDGADPDCRGEDGDTGLHRAIRKGRISIAALLAQNGCNLEVPNSKGQSALMSAVAWGHKGIVCKLLLSGANAACADPEGKTPLHAAAVTGDVGIIKALLRAGAKMEAEDSMQETPLHLAVMHSHLAATALLANRAQPSLMREIGDSLVHKAITFASPEVLEVIVRAGANVNATDKFGLTAMHLVACRGCPRMARCLVEAGADCAAFDQMVTSPMQMAISLNPGADRVEVVRIILEALGSPKGKQDHDDDHGVGAHEDRASLEELMARVASDRETNFGEDNFNATFLAPRVWKEVPVHKVVSVGKSEPDQRVLAGYVKGAARGVYRRKYLPDLGIMAYSYLGEFHYNELGVMVGHELNCCHA